jgi:hypothetical protein
LTQSQQETIKQCATFANDVLVPKAAHGARWQDAPIVDANNSSAWRKADRRTDPWPTIDERPINDPALIARLESRDHPVGAFDDLIPPPIEWLVVEERFVTAPFNPRPGNRDPAAYSLQQKEGLAAKAECRFTPPSVTDALRHTGVLHADSIWNMAAQFAALRSERSRCCSLLYGRLLISTWAGED